MTQKQAQQIRELYQSEYRRLFALAYARLSDPVQANDAVQQTFLVACCRPDALLNGPHPAVWLLHTLQRVIWQFLRDRAKRDSLPLEDVYLLPAQDPEPLALELLYGNLAETEAFRLVKAISIEGRTYEELAAELGISVNACRIRVMRARKFLQAKLKTDEML